MERWPANSHTYIHGLSFLIFCHWHVAYSKNIEGQKGPTWSALEWMLNKKRVIEVRWTMENDSDTVKGPTEPHPHSPLHTYYVRHSATEWIPITIIITLQIFLISDFTQLSLPLSSSSPFLFSFNYYYPVLTLLSLSYS
jgi:hypothetical protein